MNGKPLAVTGLVLCLYFLGCIALTHRTNDLYESLLGKTPLGSNDIGTHRGQEHRDLEESESGSDRETYLEVVVALLLGLSSARCAFRNLQFGRQRGRNIWLLLLAFSFVMCAYGLGLLLEVAAEGG
jgi:hypothetical protein